MKVYGINLCNINTYTGIKKKHYINNHDYQDTFVRQNDMAFGSSDVDYDKKLEELFTNPKYQRAHEILAPVYERIKNPCLRTECVDNEYKLKFIEYVLSVLSVDKCPYDSNTIIIKELFSEPKDFISYYENIDSEESLDAKKSALNFLLKHPDYTASKIDYDTMFGAYSGPKTLLQLIKSEHAKEFLAHIDSNYDGKFTATQLKTDLGTICGGISSKEKAQACKDIFDFCCKCGYYDASINTYLSAVGDEHGVKYIKTILPKAYSRKTKEDHLNSEFLNWYFIGVINTPKKCNTAIELYKKAIEDPVVPYRFSIGFRELGEMLYYNENITAGELMGIDSTFDKLPNPIRYDFEKKLLEILKNHPETWKEDINAWLDSRRESIDWNHRMYPELYPNKFYPEF